MVRLVLERNLNQRVLLPATPKAIQQCHEPVTVLVVAYLYNQVVHAFISPLRFVGPGCHSGLNVDTFLFESFYVRQGVRTVVMKIEKVRMASFV